MGVRAGVRPGVMETCSSTPVFLKFWRCSPRPYLSLCSSSVAPPSCLQCRLLSPPTLRVNLGQALARSVSLSLSSSHESPTTNKSSSLPKENTKPYVFLKHIKIWSPFCVGQLLRIMSVVFSFCFQTQALPALASPVLGLQAFCVWLATLL